MTSSQTPAKPDAASAKPADKAAGAPPAAYPPMSGLNLALATMALSLAVFMIVLDSTIANVALPTIAGDLGAAISQGTWVITMFAVANAIAIPLTGFLARRFGQVRVFLFSGLLFVLCSWLCGIAHSLIELIIFRICQGAVAGPMIPLAQSLLLQCYPPEKRPMALGLFSMVIVTAPIFGPMLGGYICDNYHWGWIFFINVPIGIFAVFIAWQQLRSRESPTAHSKVDYIGLALLVAGVGCLQLMLDRGSELDWFNSAEIQLLCAISVICLIYLAIWEWDHANPVVDLRLFTDRNFTVGTIVISLAFMIYMGAIVLLPLVLQQNLGYTAVWAGLAAAPIGIFPVLLTPIIGKYGSRIDMRILVSLSFIVYCSTFVWRSDFNAQMDYWDVFWPQCIQGIGTAMFFMPLTTITLSRIAPPQLPAAAGLSNFARTLFGGIGTSLITNTWSNRSIEHHQYLTESITPYSANAQAWLSQLQASGMSQEQAYAQLNRLITQQSSIIGSNEVFYISGLMFLALLFLVWFAKPPFSHSGK